MFGCCPRSPKLSQWIIYIYFEHTHYKISTALIRALVLWTCPVFTWYTKWIACKLLYTRFFIALYVCIETFCTDVTCTLYMQLHAWLWGKKRILYTQYAPANINNSATSNDNVNTGCESFFGLSSILYSFILWHENIKWQTEECFWEGVGFLRVSSIFTHCQNGRPQKILH